MRIIRGKYGKRRFDVPKNITARPTTDFARENLFNVLDNMSDFENSTALDLFAGTGAISLEFLSRGCSEVIAVEKARVQANFIKSVTQTLNETRLKLIVGDVFRFIDSVATKFDFVFADPPYDHPRFGEIPQAILSSKAVGPGTIFIMEHSSKFDFSALPYFQQQRVYGSVNFSIFVIPEDAETNE